MKAKLKWTSLVLCLALLMGCATDNKSSDSSDKAEPAAIETEDKAPTFNVTDDPTAAPVNQPPEPVNVPAGPDGVVAHYICADGCVGGTGDGGGPCPVCGKAMAHNKAFHAQPEDAAATTNPAVPAVPPAPEPAQNALGVWHYTCSNGCAGGAGSAGPCSSCGNILAHNAAYHN